MHLYVQSRLARACVASRLCVSPVAMTYVKTEDATNTAYRRPSAVVVGDSAASDAYSKSYKSATEHCI